MNENKTIELSYEERATFGDCPICPAKHGEVCNDSFGIKLGVGGIGGVHLGRLQNAPKSKTITYNQ